MDLDSIFKKDKRTQKHIEKFIKITTERAGKFDIELMHAECFEVNHATFEPYCSECSKYEKCLEMKEEVK